MYVRASSELSAPSLSDSKSVGGPYGLIQMRSVVLSIVAHDLFGMMAAWLNRVATHMMCSQGSLSGSMLFAICCFRCCAVCPAFGDTNIKSACVRSLNLSTRRAVACDVGDGLRHVRQALQVSAMSSTRLMAFSGAPCSLEYSAKSFRLHMPPSDVQHPGRALHNSLAQAAQ